MPGPVNPAHDDVSDLIERYTTSIERWQQALLEAEGARRALAGKVQAAGSVWREVAIEAASANRRVQARRGLNA